MRRVLIMGMVLALPAMAQRITPGSQGSPRVPIVKFPSLASDPSTCTVGSVYFNTTTSKLRQCYAANTWGDVLTADASGNVAVGGTVFTPPQAGDAAAGKYLDAAGGWTVPPGGSATSVGDCIGADCFSAAGSGTALVFRNADSGTITLTPVSGALGDVTLNLPAQSGTLARLSDIPIGGSSLMTVVANTGDGTISAANLQRATHTNTGAAGTVTLTLGEAQCTVGYAVTFYVTETQAIKVVPFTGDQIMTLTDAATDSITSDTIIGSFVSLGCLAEGKWYLLGMNGAWTDTN